MAAPSPETVRSGGPNWAPGQEGTPECPPAASVRPIGWFEKQRHTEIPRSATQIIEYRVFTSEDDEGYKREAYLNASGSIIGRCGNGSVDRPLTQLEERMIGFSLGRIVFSDNGLAYRRSGSLLESIDFASEWGNHTGIVHGVNGFGPMHERSGTKPVVAADEYKATWDLACRGIEEARKLEVERVSTILQELPWTKAFGITEQQICAYLEDMHVYPIHPNVRETYRLFPMAVQRNDEGQLESVLPGIATLNGEQYALQIVVEANGVIRTEQFVPTRQSESGECEGMWFQTYDPLYPLGFIAAIGKQEYTHDTQTIHAITHDGNAVFRVDRQRGSENVFGPTEPDIVTFAVAKQSGTTLFRDHKLVDHHAITPVERDMAGTATQIEHDQSAVVLRYRDLRIKHERETGKAWIEQWVDFFEMSCRSERQFSPEEKTRLLKFLTTQYDVAVQNGTPMQFPQDGLIAISRIQPSRSRDEFAEALKTGFIAVRWNEPGKNGVVNRIEHQIGSIPDINTSPQRSFFRYNVARALVTPQHISGDYAAAFNLTSQDQSILATGAGTTRRHWLIRMGQTGGMEVVGQDAAVRVLEDTPSDRRFGAVYQFLHGELAFDVQARRLVATSGKAKNPSLITISGNHEMAPDLAEQVFAAGERLWYEEKLRAASEALAELVNTPIGQKSPANSPRVTADQLYTALSRHVGILSSETGRPGRVEGQIGMVEQVLFYPHTGNVTVRMALHDILGHKDMRNLHYEYIVTNGAGKPVVSVFQSTKEGLRRRNQQYVLDTDTLHYRFLQRFIERQCVLTRDEYISIRNQWVEAQVGRQVPGMYARNLTVDSDRRITSTHITMIAEGMGGKNAGKKTVTEYEFKDDDWVKKGERVTPVEKLWLTSFLAQPYAMVDGAIVTLIDEDLATQNVLREDISKELAAKEYIRLLKEHNFTAVLVSLALNEIPDSVDLIKGHRFKEELLAQLKGKEMIVNTTYDLGRPGQTSAQNNIVLLVGNGSNTTSITIGFHRKNLKTFIDELRPEPPEERFILEEVRGADGTITIRATDVNVFEPSRWEKRRIARTPEARTHGEPTYMSGAINLMYPELRKMVIDLGKTSFANRTFRTVRYNEILWGLIAQVLQVDSGTPWVAQDIAEAWASHVLAPYERFVALQS